MNFVTQLFSSLMNVVVQVFRGFVSGLLTPLPQQQRREMSVDVVRVDDLLVGTLDFYNLTLQAPGAGGGLSLLEAANPGDSFIVLRLPPQSMGEQAFLETGDVTTREPAGPPPVAARLAGESQLVFRLGSAQLPLAYSLEEILGALSQAEPVTRAEITQPPPTPPVGANAFFSGPRAQFTAVEAPWRLVLSPTNQSRWQHAAKTVSDHEGKRVELWHTRLTGNPSVRAVHSPDYAPDGTTPPDDKSFSPFLASLAPEHRHKLVRSMGDRGLFGRRAATADFLALSALGAWMRVRGTWDTELHLVEWRHVLTAGRDQYVRVVKEGVLFETGHRAVFVRTTERKIEPVPRLRRSGGPGAYLRQTLTIELREETKTYSHRHSPFRSITIKTKATPPLELPANSEIAGKGEEAFWPRVAVAGIVKDFEFELSGVTWDGRVVEYSKPLAFIGLGLHDNDVLKFDAATIAGVPVTPPTNARFIDALVAAYNTTASNGNPRQKRDFHGQQIGFAPPDKPADTTLPTASMTFGALLASGSPRFLPAMTEAVVDVPDARNLTGNSTPSSIAYEPSYLASSGTVIGNASDVFVRMSKLSPLALPKDRTGGLVAPNLDISGLSRTLGPVGGKIDDMVAGHFKPADVFGNVTILGGIKLGDIIKEIDFGHLSGVGEQIPKLKSVRTTKPYKGANREVIETSYRWELGSSGLLQNALFKRSDDATFYIETVVDAPLDGTEPQILVTGGMTKFQVVLIPGVPALELVGLNFDCITFSAKQNAKVDVSIDFAGFDFLGPLSFVNKLREVIPFDGFSDPPYLEIILPPDTRAGISSGFTLSIPSLGIGIFTLQNISLSAGFYLPLIDAPANLRLAFCQRQQPFILTVMAFGGGGFFSIDIGMAGVTQIEAALEFGASVALNLGVASGSATIMGGVYFQQNNAGVHVSAYFRAAGALSVLGIITVSVELYIGLDYASKGMVPHGGKLWGQASLKVKVKIAFFSTSVTLHIEREFAGSDPTLADAMEPDDWQEYCAAFANYA